MKRLLAAMLALGSLTVSCTGRGAVSPTPSFPSVAPSIVRIAKPQDITVLQAGSLFVAAPTGHAAPNFLWAHSVVRSAGAVCATLKPPGFHFTASDVSDAEITMAITCEADGSHHTVRVIFTPESD